ncbi:ComEC/Rec2 family competence protein [Suttonella sp. R2A3]|uniref:ComEC/Rec2 family competence protein n=1 Tax=Suttonella sp. R2A3 TaxID=2908648 RepID=UPI001F1CA4B3|nr:ComEC/Rec2 family competence protein [Suttonella sp. R2A3]UJF23856.1 ComEC/Rec2 family competence protein [Suttonella sp. R2A3]
MWRYLRWFGPWHLLALLCVSSWWFTEPDKPTPTLTLSEPVQCTVLFHANDFPRSYPPRTHILPATIIESSQCPQLTGLSLDLRYYRALKFDLKVVQSGQLRLKQRDNGRLSATLNHSQYTQTLAPWRVRWRATISEHINAHYGADSARWLNALLIGNRSGLTADDKMLLRRSGTSHLLAISGLHLGLVSLIAYVILKFSFAQSRSISALAEPRSLALIGTLTIAGFFVLLTGAQPPVIRAWLLFCAIAAAWFIPYLRNGLHGLAWAGILMLAYQPANIHHIGAWLSFMATAVVLLAYQQWAQKPLWRFWLLLQAAITLALLLPIWAIFGGISISSIMVNLLVIPWLAPLWVISALGVIYAPLAELAAHCLAAYLRVIAAFAEPSWAYVIPSWQPGYWVAFTGFIGVLCVLFARGKQKIIALVAAIILLFSYLVPSGNEVYRLPHNDHVALITLGRDAYLINSGYRHARGRDDVMRYILPEIRKHRAQLRAVILTSDKARDNTALKTLRETYPELPFYALKPRLELPFSYQYCPNEIALPPALTFSRYPRCSATINGQWHILADGKIQNQ